MDALLISVNLHVQRLGRWLLRIPLWLFVLLASVIAALKTTFNWSGSFLGAAAEAFPAAQSELSTNFLGIIIYLASDGSAIVFLGMSVAAVVAAMLLIVTFQHSARVSPAVLRVSIILALSWPVLMSNLTWLGTGNAFLPLFIVLVVMGPRWWVALLGIIGAVATHPEQAFTAAFCLLVLTFAPEFRHLRLRALIFTLLGAAITGLTALWLANAGIPGRLAKLDETLGDGLRATIRNGVLGAYAWWGLWWLVVIIAIVALSRRGALLVVISAVLLPGLFVASTLDGTRVFTGVASAVGLALLMYVTRSVPTTSAEPPPIAQASTAAAGVTTLGYFFGALVLLPNLQFMMWSDPVPRPGPYWLGLFENYGIGAWNSLFDGDGKATILQHHLWR